VNLFTENDVYDEALVAVCRTTYRRIVEVEHGSADAAKAAVRFELARAGYEVIKDEDDVSKGLKTVVVMLADGRYVQRDALGGWHVHRNPAAC
jgi:hypothetical protein